MKWNNFYTYQIVEESIDSIIYQITFNSNHAIFEGHFPQNPIVPGVCQLQIVHELYNLTKQKSLIVSQALNLKYTGIINPLIHPSVFLKIDFSENEGITSLSTQFYLEQSIFSKMRIKLSSPQQPM